jgi:hypothetical protein
MVEEEIEEFNKKICLSDEDDQEVVDLNNILICLKHHLMKAEKTINFFEYDFQKKRNVVSSFQKLPFQNPPPYKKSIPFKPPRNTKKDDDIQFTFPPLTPIKEEKKKCVF